MAWILFPSIRDLSVLPPVINAINYISNSQQVIVYSYYGQEDQFTASTKLKFISKTPYPKKIVPRYLAKTKSWISFYFFIINNAKRFDFIWMGVWDYPFIRPLLKISGFKGKLIYQMHELEFHRFKHCRKADFVIVPDENRAWITFFLGKLKNQPLVLPNIPFLPSELSLSEEPEIAIVKKSNPQKKIVLYQGTIDYVKRCIPELLQAFKKLPDNFLLVIMPGSFQEKKAIERIKEDASALGISSKVQIINTVKAPYHLLSVKYADLGIGLYRPSSLNQIYAAPNRLYEFTMFDIPLVLPDFPYFKALAVKFPYAINTVNPESVDQIAQTIQTLVQEENYILGKINARKFTDTEGNYALSFNKCWEVISPSI